MYFYLSLRYIIQGEHTNTGELTGDGFVREGRYWYTCEFVFKLYMEPIKVFVASTDLNIAELKAGKQKHPKP